ncbi:MAG: Activator of Hsp90 ATPase 1 family protein [Actinomycetia bacterium]|nr:Activator of Hsp90 ATPase 1 family protein [Actinomycetes bacterium]
MTTPDVPHRFELSIEVPGTPEQVWAAIATANGISSWMLPTTMEEREGGHLAFHMGDTDSEGTVTGWDPPRRLAYVEPDWATLAGQAGAAVTPMATEFLVEAQAGGTCVVRVVSSAFGTGADWENEFWASMAEGWLPAFDFLRLYLEHFPGQTVTTLTADAALDRPQHEVLAAMVSDLGSRGVTSELVQRNDLMATYRLTAPVPGFLTLIAADNDGATSAVVQGHLFSPDAAGYVEREQKAWQAWLEGLEA